MKQEFVNKLTRVYYHGKLKVQKYSPEILMTAGIAGTIIAAVSACKRTLKVSSIIEEKNELTGKVYQCLEDKSIDYDKKDASRDLTVIYTNTGVELIKLYAPSVLLGSLSIASIVSGNRILRKRNMAIAAAYTIVDKSFKRYRENVIERYGQGTDQELRFGIKAEEMEIADEKGKKKKYVVETVNATNEDFEYSDYARFFDAASEYFHKDPEYNLMYLRRQQDYANELLKSRGHLFLNEVYDLLDIPRTKAGQMVGWIYDPKNNKDGDNYVDFGIYKENDPHRRFVNGLEYNILLDFNVDGVICDLI